MQRRTYVIDGSRFHSLEGFWDEVGRELFAGQRWGRNLDAFGDMLHLTFAHEPAPVLLVWKNSVRSQERLGYGATAGLLARRLKNSHKLCRGRVRKQLESARSGVGPTAFDWLVEIVRCNRSVELRLE